ncbi:hypothetical protein ACWDXT_24995 [Streptomyces sp. NPDC003236]
MPVLAPPLGRSPINHFTPLIADQGDAIDRLADRLAGKPAGSACRALPVQP